MTETTPDFDPVAQIKQLSKREIGYGVVRFAAKTSVKLVIGTAISQLVPTETPADKAKVIVGTYLISGIVADAAKTKAVADFDKALSFASAIKNKISEGQVKTAS